MEEKNWRRSVGEKKAKCNCFSCHTARQNRPILATAGEIKRNNKGYVAYPTNAAGGIAWAVAMPEVSGQEKREDVIMTPHYPGMHRVHLSFRDRDVAEDFAAALNLGAKLRCVSTTNGSAEK